MDPITAAALIGGVSSGINALTSGINSKAQQAAARYNTDATIKANKENTAFAYQKDLEQWHRSNAYNNPTEQMKRLKSGGLNPMLVYGSGSVAGNSDGPSPKMGVPEANYGYQAAQLPQIDAMGVMQNTLGLQYTKAQTNNVEAQTNAVKQRTAMDVINTAAAKVNLDFLPFEKSAHLTQEKAKANHADQSEYNKVLLQAAQHAAQNLANDQARASNPIQLEFLKGQNELQAKTIQEKIQAIANAKLSGKNIEAQTAQTYAQTGKTDQETRNAQLQNVLMDQDRLMKAWEIYLNEQGTYKGDTPWGNVTRRSSQGFEKFLQMLNTSDAWLGRNYDKIMGNK